MAFKFGPLTVHWYGVLVALGFLAGLWTASRRAPQAGLSPERVLDLGPWLIVGAILGARFLYVVSYWDREFAGKPLLEVIMIHRGGLVYYGGLMGASLACILYVLIRRMPLWNVADVLAPSVALGYVFGRMGCLLNGCCFGKPTDLPWAIQFPPGHDAYPDHVHPTQVYDALLSAALYAFLAWVFRRRQFHGQVFAVYLIGYAILRSFVEVFRGDYAARYYLGVLTPAHQVSIGIFLAGVILWFLLPKKSPEKKP